jgi:hypothetical protein
MNTINNFPTVLPLHTLSPTLSFTRVSRSLKGHKPYNLYMFITCILDEFTELEDRLNIARPHVMTRYWAINVGEDYIVEALSVPLKCKNSTEAVINELDHIFEMGTPSGERSFDDNDYSIFYEMDETILQSQNKTPALQLVK